MVITHEAVSQARSAIDNALNSVGLQARERAEGASPEDQERAVVASLETAGVENGIEAMDILIDEMSTTFGPFGGLVAGGVLVGLVIAQQSNE